MWYRHYGIKDVTEIRLVQYGRLGCLDGYRENVHCDVILVADDVEIHAHRAKLAGCNSYFHAMFTNFAEKRQHRVEIKGIDSSALASLIHYIYAAEIQINEENVQNLLAAACLLQFDDVRDLCCKFLESQLHWTNCLSIREFSESHGCFHLSRAADSYVQLYISKVVEGEEFFRLSVNRVMEIIKKDVLNFYSEEELFECTMKWVRHDTENRKNYLPALMEHIRLPLIREEYLAKNICEESLIRNNSQCLEYVVEAQRFHSLKSNERASIQTLRTKPRQYRMKALLVLSNESNPASSKIRWFNLTRNEWIPFRDGPREHPGCELVVLGNEAYFIGGWASSCVNSVNICSTESETEKYLSGVPMKTKRTRLGTAVLNNKIYAIGGVGECCSLKTAEVFDLKTRQWTAIASMCIRRCDVGVAVLNNYVYAVGGFNGTSLSSVECYNPETNTWRRVSDMSCKRSGAAVGVVDGILYAVGGASAGCCGGMNTGEAYDPSTDVWRPIAPMHERRENAGAVSYNGLLYVVGGAEWSGSKSRIEVYCAKKNKWTFLPKSPSTVGKYVRVAMTDYPLDR